MTMATDFLQMLLQTAQEAKSPFAIFLNCTARVVSRKFGVRACLRKGGGVSRCVRTETFTPALCTIAVGNTIFLSTSK